MFRAMKKKNKTTPKPSLQKIGGKPIEAVIEPCRRPGLIPLSEKEPGIALEWYYPKNCGFGPEDFSFGSQVNAWWQCSINNKHIWRVRILTRCVQKRGCPYCLGTNLRVPVPFERSLACCDPELAKEWHSKRNKELTPKDVLAHSTKLVWWQCQTDPKHAWQQDVCRRAIERTGCPHCFKEAKQSLDKYPEALKFYDRKKNLYLNPERVCLRTTVWWRCPVASDHSWREPFKKRMRCPFCSKKKASSTSSLQILFPKLAAEIHPTRNKGINASELRAFGPEYIWWRCRYNPSHIWRAKVDNRTRNESGCPECWKLRRPKLFKKLAAERKARANQTS
ncbi:MAG TPA: hypothetical protein EYN91_22320 [Candidatus Melainabacteria bacterium]|nr:hypothetical protein [Candidatus Melainabacteria bacterium]HIN63493.1 hypothetical protein [Candidatus Obscuribacterales bacterium]